MKTFYDECNDRWTLSLRSQERWGCEPATHLLMDALGGDSTDEYVQIGTALVMLTVEDGRLVQVVVDEASTVLQDDVIFSAVRRDAEPDQVDDEPF